MQLDGKAVSQVSMCTVSGTFGTDGTLVFNQLSFLRKRPLQQLNTQKPPCLPSAGNGDLIGVFQIVSTFILLQERCHGFLCQRVQSVVFAPKFVCLIQIPGTGSCICFELEIAMGLHEIYQVVSVCYGIFHVDLGPVTESKLVVIPDQPMQAFQRPQKNTFFFPAELFCQIRIVLPVRVPFLCFGGLSL